MKHYIFSKSDLNLFANTQSKDNQVFDYKDNLHINSMIENVDSLLKIYSNQTSSFYKSKEIKSEIEKVFDALHSFISMRSANNQVLQQCLQGCVECAKNYIFDYFINNVDNHLKYNKINSFYSNSKLRDLQLNGYVEYSIENTELFESESQLLLDYARSHYREKDDWRSSAFMDPSTFPDSKIFKLIQEFIDKNGIFELASDYMDSNLEMAWAFPNYSHHRQQWFRIQEQEAISATNYYHIDKDRNMVKILIYLTDVNDQDGPFKYVKGSNLWKKSICTFALHYGIDFKVNTLLIGKESDFKNNIFTTRTDILSQFPDAFIGSTHFGDFLHRDSDTTKLLLDESVVFTRKRGTLIIFDGGMGVHSGGNAHGGERLAIQIGYRKKLTIKRDILKQTKELARKVKHKVASFSQ